MQWSCCSGPDRASPGHSPNLVRIHNQALQFYTVFKTPRSPVVPLCMATHMVVPQSSCMQSKRDVLSFLGEWAKPYRVLLVTPSPGQVEPP